MSAVVKVGVGVWVVRGGRVLMGQRLGSHGAGTWAPPGGHVDFGETFEQTAAREVWEETWLEVGAPVVRGVTNDRFTLSGKHYATVWLTARCRDGEPSLVEPDRCAGWRWVELDQLDDLGPLFLTVRNLREGPFWGSIEEVVLQESL